MTPPATSEPGGVATDSDDAAAKPAVQEALADFAARLDVEQDAITVLTYAEVTWSDGSLGCPQPGMQYTQALVPGQQLILSVADSAQSDASYHAGKNGTFKYCASPQPPISGDSST